MEVGFDLGSGRSSPAINYSSAPTSPRRSGLCFFSAPTSPSRASEFYDSPLSAIPFHWEETPGTPKSPGTGFDFAFDVSLEPEKNSASAEQLFDGGKIRPLKPPPRLLFEHAKQSDPFADKKTEQDSRGGRSRRDSNWRHRITRSLSPFRFSHFQQEQQQQQQNQRVKQSSSFSWSTKGFSKKWSFKNFLLFRSASEGCASGKDYAPLSNKQEEDVNNSSFLGAPQDLKRKTSLPCKQGVLGRLAFGSMLHALGNGSASFGR